APAVLVGDQPTDELIDPILVLQPQPRGFASCHRPAQLELDRLANARFGKFERRHGHVPPPWTSGWTIRAICWSARRNARSRWAGTDCSVTRRADRRLSGTRATSGIRCRSTRTRSPPARLHRAARLTTRP